VHPRAALSWIAVAAAYLTAVLAVVTAVVVPAEAAAAPVQRPSTSAPKLGRALDRLVAAGVPGAVVLVRDGRRTIRLTRGFADPAHKVRMTVADRFRVGSITKTFVSTVVLQLAGEGRLALDDTLERWLPGLVPNGQAITIAQLLNHTSGLFDYTLDPAVLRPYLRGDLRFDWPPRQLVARAITHPPLFAPAARWSYSNTGYVLLGLVVQAATGGSLRAQLQRRIFGPLRLPHHLCDHTAHRGPARPRLPRAGQATCARRQRLQSLVRVGRGGDRLDGHRHSAVLPGAAARSSPTPGPVGRDEDNGRHGPARGVVRVRAMANREHGPVPDQQTRLRHGLGPRRRLPRLPVLRVLQ